MNIYNNTSTLQQILSEMHNFTNGDSKRLDALLIERSFTSLDLSNIEIIGSSAFTRCSNLINAFFPDCITIGNDAFSHCSKLTNISFPKCTEIGKGAFASCVSLSKITLMASSVCKLKNSAFSSTGINQTSGSIYVPMSLVAAYQSAVYWSEFSNRIFGI